MEKKGRSGFLNEKEDWKIKKIEVLEREEQRYAQSGLELGSIEEKTV